MSFTIFVKTWLVRVVFNDKGQSNNKDVQMVLNIRQALLNGEIALSKMI